MACMVILRFLTPYLSLVVWTLLAWTIAQYYRPVPITNRPPLTNYDGSYSFPPDKVYLPTSLAEIVAHIKNASSHGDGLKILGSGHSRSAIVHSDSMYLSLREYRGVVAIDEAGKMATVRGGTTLMELVKELGRYNLSLPVLPAITEQTITGAIATGTHGSGMGVGNLATLVTKIQLVTGEGEVMSLIPSDKLFHAVGVSMGLLGVITEVTVKCKDSFNLEETRTTHTLSHCLHDMASIATSAEHVKLWTEVNSQSCYIHAANRTRESPRNNPSDTVSGIKMMLWEVFQFIFAFIPSLTSPGMKLLFHTDFFFSPYNRVASSNVAHTVLYYMSSNKQMEIAVPVENCEEAFRDLLGVVASFDIPLNHIIEIRFVKGDNFWLSNDYKRDTCHITPMMYYPSPHLWALYTTKLYQALLKYNGRPHWGKSFDFVTPADIHRLYPQFEEFLHVRKQLDPSGIFLNKELVGIFGADNSN